jgi:hypothetical protein
MEDKREAGAPAAIFEGIPLAIVVTELSPNDQKKD